MDKIFSRFRRPSLNVMKFSNKLFFVIFITGLTALIILSFAIYKYNYDSMIALQSIYTKSIANEISDDIDHLLLEKVKTALTLANTPVIKQALGKSIVSYADLSDEKRKESIKLLNEQWKSTKNPEDDFILKFTDNKVSHFLKNQQKVLTGEYGEIFLTDKFGALVASTSKLSTFAHGHKYWWLGSYNNGKGAVFFDDRGYDDSVGGYVLGLVVPVKKGNEIIGILKCNLNILGNITELITGAEDKLIGKFKLVRSGGMVVFEEGFEPLSTKVNDDIFQQLKSNNQRTVITNDSGEKHLVGFAQIKLTKDEKGYGFGGNFESIDHKKGNTGESWYILCSRQMSVVRAPVIESIKSILLIGFAIIVILLFVSYLFGKKIGQPLALINKATQKIGKGNFEYRIDISQNDEFGNLARSFNQMADKLQHTTTSIELFENELAERKRAENALRENESFIRAVMDNLPIGIAVNSVDPTVNFDYMNNNFPKFYRTNREVLADPNGFWAAVYEDSTFRGKIKKRILDDCDSGDPGRMYWENIPIIRKGEETTFINAKNIPIPEKQLMISTVWDVTERKLAEELLQASHERLFAVLNSIDATIYVADMETYEILFMNKNMIEHFGRDMTGDICWKVFRGESKPCSHCTNDQLIDKNGVPADVFIWQGKNPVLGKWYNNYDRAIEWTDGRLVRLQIATDITSFKQMEAQLQQALKMESIGTLTGGIAHDFNNIMAIIVGNTKLALEDVPESNRAHANLKEIEKASLRAKNIVKQLLSFSRKTDQKEQPIQIASVIKNALKFLRSTIPTTINIHRDIQTTEEMILADPTQINQIIMNLCINASHAMEQTGGDLTVTVEKVILDHQSLKDYPDLKSGDHVKIMVSDTGPGIDPEIIDQIFDPYFTTKEVGKGSGMGLAVVHGIVKNYNGVISVDSSQGKGTKFNILFPLAKEKPMVETKTTQDIPKGNETMLFVDDEISIVKMVKRMFERLGYKVETATTPQDALEQFRSKPDHFDLVITDMTMPQMTGVILSEKLMDIREDIPIIICTGQSALVDEEKAKELNLAAFIMKPIDMQETAQTIRKVLDK